MARYNEEQSKQIQEERKEQILKASLPIFGELGIEGAKMDMIAKAAGVSKGLMYHYFESKEEVLNTSLRWALSRSTELLDHVKAMPVSPIEKIHLFTKNALSLENQDVFRIIQRFVDYPGLDSVTKGLIEKSSGDLYMQTLLPIFEEGQQCGEIIEGDLEKLLNLYLTILSGLLMEDVDWGEDIDWYVEKLLRVIKK